MIVWFWIDRFERSGVESKPIDKLLHLSKVLRMSGKNAYAEENETEY
jgi:hypothetical protein